MLDRHHISLQVTIVLLFLHETCIYAAHISNYGSLFQKLLSDTDDNAGSQPERLEFVDVYGQDNLKNEDNYVISGLEDTLLSQPIDKLAELSPLIEDQQLLSGTIERSTLDEQLEHPHRHNQGTSPMLLPELLEMIENLHAPRYKGRDESVDKRNDWDKSSVFGSLLKAAHRLGQLEGEKPKVQGRRFHAWGG